MKEDKARSLRYLFKVVLFSVLGVACVAGLNMYIDFYGLFKPQTGVKKYIYHHEMITKYLFSYDYIPSNFNAVLLGPSLSDNLNSQNISNEDTKYYNASIMGANISELSKTLRNVVKNGELKSVILCLHPYVTKDFGDKAVTLDSSLYYAAFSSLNLYHSYFFSLVRKLELFPNRYPKYQCDYFGTNDYNDSFKSIDVIAKIKEEAMIHKDEELVVNDEAFKELGDLIQYLREHKIIVSGYFHPMPQLILESNLEAILSYQSSVMELFNTDEIVIDFNSEEYAGFRLDYSNYIDHGHLSKSGLRVIESEIFTRIVSKY